MRLRLFRHLVRKRALKTRVAALGLRMGLACLIASTGTLQPWSEAAMREQSRTVLAADPEPLPQMPTLPDPTDPVDGEQHIVEPGERPANAPPPPPDDPILPAPAPPAFREKAPSAEVDAKRRAPVGEAVVPKQGRGEPVQPSYGDTAVRDDGTVTARLSTRPVRSTDPGTGQREKFDNEAAVASGGRARFGSAEDLRTGRPLLQLGDDRAGISMRVPGMLPVVPEVRGASVTYEGALPGAMLRYRVDGEVVKEEVTVVDRAAALSLPGTPETVTLSYEVELKGVQGTPTGDGGISFSGESGKELFRMLPSFAVDQAAGPPARTPGVILYEPRDGGADVRVNIDRAWLLDPARVYPVTIDPSFVQTSLVPPESGAKDTWVDQANPNLNRDLEQALWAGKSGVNASHILLQFADLDGLPKDSIVSSASLQLYPPAGGGGAATPLEVHRITANWAESTVTWNTAPAYDAAVEATATANTGGVTSFDLTTLVRRWVSGEVPNFGVRITGTPSASTQAGFASGNATDPAIRPALVVNYTVATRYGTDRRWTYGPVQQYGGGTSSQVNLTNGNLVVQHVTSSIGARGFDVRLAHVYNSQDPYGTPSDGTTVGGAWYGNGWTFSHNIRLAEFDNGNGVRLKDGDGTWRIYVKQQDSGSTRTYRRPLYYDYTLTKDLSAGTYTLTADAGLRKHFFDSAGKLTRTEDRNGNYLNYAYSGDKLTSITDVAGRATTLTYNGAGGRLSRITDMAGRHVDFGYDASGNLASATRAPGLTEQALTEFIYDWMGNLISIETPRYNSSEGVGASSLLYRSEATFDSGTEGWTAAAPCGGSATAIATGGALHSDLTGAPCVTLSKGLTPGPLNGARQELVAWVRVQATAPSMNANLFLEDRYGVTHSGPTANLTVSGSPWNRVAWPDAPVDAALSVQKIGVKVLVTGGSGWTGWVEVDSFAQKGLTAEQKDALNNRFATYTYTPGDSRTVIGRPDQGNTLQNSTYTFNRHGQVTEAKDPLNNATTYGYDEQARLVSTSAPVPVPVQPNQVPNLKLWLKADAITGVTDGSPVGTWTDSSGNNYSYTGSGTTRPAYKANASNGRPALTFTGSQWLEDTGGQSTNWSSDQPFTFLVAARVDGTSWEPLFANRSATGNGQGFKHWVGPGQTSTSHTISLYKPASGVIQAQATAATSTGAYHVFTATHASGLQPSSLLLYQDGNAQPVSQTGTETDPWGQSANPRVGWDRRDNTGFHGEIAELIVFTRVLTAEERTQLEGYLRGKYLGSTTTLTYWNKANGDPTNFAWTATDALGHTSRFGVDTATGDLRYTLTSLQEANRAAGQQFAATIYVRDAAGNVTSEEHNRYAAGADLDGSFPAPLQQYSKTQYAYYSGGLASSTTDPLNAITSFDYDGGSRNKGYLTSRTHPPINGGSRTWTFTVASDGRVTLATDPTARATSYAYDNLGRLVTIGRGIQNGSPPLYTESVTYDKHSNVFTTTNGRAYSTTNTYDGNNRLTKVTDARGGETRYAYYPNGQLQTRTDADNRVTSYGYDARNLLATVTNPLNQTTTNGYDGAGNRSSRLDPAGVTTSYAYSPRGELVRITYPDAAQNVSYRFDADGRRASMADSRGATTFTYDPYRPLLTSVADPVLGTMSYQYDAAGNRTRIAYPTYTGVSLSPDVDYTYHAGGYLKEVKAPFMGSGGTGGLVGTYQYDNAGRQTRLDVQGGAYSTWTYDAAGRNTQVFHRTFFSTSTYTYNYTFDNAGNVTNGPAGAFTYDAVDRITSESWGDKTYSWDNAGNRLTHAKYDYDNDRWETTYYTYDAAARLTFIDGLGSDNTTQTYDVKGNLEKVTSLQPSRSYGWDHENRRVCTGYLGPSGEVVCTTTTATYSGDGLRTKTTGGTLEGGGSRPDTYFLYDLNDSLPKFVVEKAMTSGSPTYTFYLFGNGLLGRRVVSGTPPEAQYYLHDRLHVRVIIKKSTSTAAAQYNYDAWGKVAGGGSTDNLYKVTSEPTDEQGSVYLRARHYDPGTGRFISTDPFPGVSTDPQSQNAYAYAGNNPVTRSDPTGMCALACPFVIPALPALGAGAQIAASVIIGVGAAVIFWANPHGSRGSPEHQEKIRERIEELEDQGLDHVGGGAEKEEVVVIPPGGSKSWRRPDITMRDPTTGEIYRENVGRSNKNGEPIAREREALDDIELATGARPGFTPF